MMKIKINNKYIEVPKFTLVNHNNLEINNFKFVFNVKKNDTVATTEINFSTKNNSENINKILNI